MMINHKPELTAADIPTELTQSDYISLNLPLTPETKNLIDAEAFKSIKPTGIIINSARAGVIDEAALDSEQPHHIHRSHTTLDLRE